MLATDAVGLGILLRRWRPWKSKWDEIYRNEIGGSISILASGYNLAVHERFWRGHDFRNANATARKCGVLAARSVKLVPSADRKIKPIEGGELTNLHAWYLGKGGSDCKGCYFGSDLPAMETMFVHHYTSPAFGHGQARMYTELEKALASVEPPHPFSATLSYGKGGVAVAVNDSILGGMPSVGRATPIEGGIKKIVTPTVIKDGEAESHGRQLLHIITCETRAYDPPVTGPSRYVAGPRASTAVGRMARSLRLDPSSRFVQTLALLQHGDASFRVRNVCTGRKWSGFLTKVSAIGESLRMLIDGGEIHPDDLVLTVDTDAVFNLPAVPLSGVVGAAGDGTGGGGGRHHTLGAYASHLFDAALAEQPSLRVIFQAEAWCWSPHRGTGCPRDASGFSCRSSCTAAMFDAYESAPPPIARLPTCSRFLNSGAAVGRARDMADVYKRWTAPPRSWAGEPPAGGALPPLSPQHCVPDDQCLAHSLMLRANGTIGVDAAERFFAAAATAVNMSASPAEVKRTPSFRWPVEGERHCGTPSCKASRRLLWRPEAEVGGRLVRAPADTACRLHPKGPLLIHFNGPLKDDWRDSAAVLSDWLVASLAERI